MFDVAAEFVACKVAYKVAYMRALDMAADPVMWTLLEKATASHIAADLVTRKRTSLAAAQRSLHRGLGYDHPDSNEHRDWYYRSSSDTTLWPVVAADFLSATRRVLFLKLDLVYLQLGFRYP
jgi:hypothetical protein